MAICQHFGVCGGCALQSLTPADYRARKRQTVIAALARAGLADAVVEAPVVMPLRSRRRALFKLARSVDGLVLGFHARNSHVIVDMRECLVLTPGLFDLVQKLRARLLPVFHPGESAELHVTDTGSGFDLLFRWERKLSPPLTKALAEALAGLGIARVMLNKDVAFGDAAPAVLIDSVAVPLPPGAFLQASAAGERALQDRMLALTKGAKTVADLFAGLGTFTLPLARKARVHAVEADGAALAALAGAQKNARGLKPVTTEKRDLFKLPLTALELKAYDAVVLDPPRAGAQAQARELARSKIARIAYVSCDASSFARDAKILADGGFRMGPVSPIDQFVFSEHIELVGGFTREI
jgi:23S rRNA (uracil1939-C5)-methyltransferase